MNATVCLAVFLSLLYSGSAAPTQENAVARQKRALSNACYGYVLMTSALSGSIDVSHHKRNRKTCRWRFEAAVDKVYAFYLDDVDAMCWRSEWMAIHDGASDTSTLLVDNCNDNITPGMVVTSSGRNAYLEIAISRFGAARLHYEQVSPGAAPGPSQTDPCTGDGLRLTGSTGQGQTPGYLADGQGTYGNSINCTWSISVSPGKIVSVTFTQFDVDIVGNVCYDYVDIYAGLTTFGTLLGFYCGQLSTFTVKSTGRNMLLNFLTNDVVQKNGFTFVYSEMEPGPVQDRLSEPACGPAKPTELTGSGQIASPGFILSQPYNAMSNCSWRVTAAGNADTIQFTAISFDLELSINCHADRLSLYDGPDNQSPLLAGPFCGSSVPSPLPRSSSSVVSVEFITDQAQQHGGFTLQYDVISAAPPVAPVVVAPVAPVVVAPGSPVAPVVVAPDSPSLPTAASAPATQAGEPCVGSGQVIYADSGVVESPKSATGLYESNLNCQWRIHASEGKVLLLNFIEFDIEIQTDCDWDYVGIYNGDSNASPLLGKFCGEGAITRKTQTNKVAITLTTDTSVNKKGFRMQYSTLDVEAFSVTVPPPPVFVTAVATPRSITSPGYPGSYPAAADFTWIISSPPGKGVSLEFEAFLLEDTESSCDSDHVTVYAGTKSQENVVGKYCGDKTGFTQNVASSTVTLNMVTDSSAQFSGFNIMYSIYNIPKAPSCGQSQVPVKKEANVNRIVGGSEANPHSLPWQVALMRDGQFICGGSLIGSKWVLTAAHCTWRSEASRFVVSVGDHDVRKTSEASAQFVDVVRIHEHVLYDGDVTRGNDLCLLELRTNVIYGDHVQPACVPTRDVTAGTKCVASGWGSLQESANNMPAKLHMVYLEVQTRASCSAKYGEYMTSTMMCAGETGRDACQGDSGGPLACLNEAGVWELQGVTSWGIGCARDGYPGIWSRVATFADWISQKTGGQVTPM